MGAKFGPPPQAGSASFGSASLRLTSLHLPGGLKPQYNYLITVTQRTLYYLSKLSTGQLTYFSIASY
jgi:hypothetical protein